MIGDAPDPIPPCGACHQTTTELGGPGLLVLHGNLQAARRETCDADLLPDGFEPEALERGSVER